jgi:catechol 2,3-dioxygenase-like lactoylglutathione lyase family enzyme
MDIPYLNKPASASVRYIVDDMDKSVDFYSRLLGFEVVIHPNPYFAWLSRGPLRLLLSRPGGGPGGGQAMPDGITPSPGGWNRISLETGDIEAAVKDLRGKNVRFRNEIVNGTGGRQILLEDPSGNLVELFEPGSRTQG